MGASRESADVEALYDAAQSGDPAAFLKLQALAARRLGFILRHRFRRLPPWEIEDMVGDVLEDIYIKRSSFPSWRGAWAYARKTCYLRSVRRTYSCLMLSLVGEPGIEERTTSNERGLLEIEEELDSFEKTLHGLRLKAFRVLRSGQPLRAELCGNFEISLRQLAREIQSVRSDLRLFLARVHRHGASGQSRSPKS